MPQIRITTNDAGELDVDHLIFELSPPIWHMLDDLKIVDCAAGGVKCNGVDCAAGGVKCNGVDCAAGGVKCNGVDCCAAIHIPLKKSILKHVVDYLARAKAWNDDIEHREMRITGEPTRQLLDWEIEWAAKLERQERVDLIWAADHLEIIALILAPTYSYMQTIRGASIEDIRNALERTGKPIPEHLSHGIPGVRIEPLPAEDEPAADEGLTAELPLGD